MLHEIVLLHNVKHTLCVGTYEYDYIQRAKQRIAIIDYLIPRIAICVYDNCCGRLPRQSFIKRQRSNNFDIAEPKMYKWVRTPSPSFPKAAVNEYSISSLSSFYEQDLSNAELVAKAKMNNTWDKRDMLDTYIHHTIMIKHDIDNMITMTTTPPRQSGINSMQRHRRSGCSPWENATDFSPFFQLESGKCHRHRDNLQSTISNLSHLESSSERSQSRKASFVLCFFRI